MTYRSGQVLRSRASIGASAAAIWQAHSALRYSIAFLLLRYARREIGTWALSFSSRGAAFVEHLKPGT